MRNSALLLAAALAVGTVATAQANLVTNGDFVANSPYGGSGGAQFGTQNLNGFQATNFINGWTGNNGYDLWFPSASASSSTEAYSVWGQGSNQNTGKEKLYSTVTAPSSPATSFVALDGEQTAGVQGGLSQTISGLSVGQNYTLSFEWGGAQIQSRSGNTTDSLQVSLGSSTKTTTVLQNQSGGFTGWQNDFMSFTANSASEALSFLSIGTPTGYPPVALLTNVSLTPNQSIPPVPEPSSFAILGAGLLGLGFLARRRAMRPRA